MAKKEHMKNQVIYVSNSAYVEQESREERRKSKESSKGKDI
ncbi:MAG: hypothetical protein ACQEXB_21860 [Bacillota bacterium]